ncbi:MULTISPECIES: hypothetical protein [unclassified Acidovorax]|uniref:hypothetical protein n=1 Tax=unclassified Acidovorax TaxID=2684926 RepID=UPI001C46DFFA|nr:MULTISPECIES: hypothetical protein [unclassified Acidovorax]MBV7426583.1 hypothetical protein [Acidovorax sp. sif0732]MBV7447708.1 hypothetical protein [Acidovorax sp. sif0715]
MIAPLHRRHFLATGGAVAATGVQLSAPVLASTGSSRPQWHILGIAPASEKLPQLAHDYRRGVELGLAQAGASQVGLTWLSAGPLPAAPAQAIGSALQGGRIDAVMGWMPPLLAKKVSALTEKAGVPLWISDSGADIAAPSEHTPLQVRHSLELCAMASALADKVYAQCGPRAFLSMGWHESGYDFIQAFQHRWRTLGGQIVGRHIAGAPGRLHEFGELREAIISQQPDVVVALFSGSQTQRFTQWWQVQQPLLRTELAGFPWLLEQNAGMRAWSVSSWPTPEHAEPRWKLQFERAGLAWTAPALLGAEAGSSVGSALVAALPGSNAKDVWSELRATPLSGPRGERQWSSASSDSTGSLWERAAPNASTWLQRHAAPLLSPSARANGGWTTGYFLT